MASLHSPTTVPGSATGGPAGHRVDTVVVGAGLAGLVAATVAAERGPGRVVLVEAHPPGGRARCDDRSGFTFNRGPRALYLGGAARPVLESLGVNVSAGAAPTVPGALGRRAGQLHLLPQDGRSLLRTTLLGPAEKARFARALVRLPRVDAGTLAGQPFGTYLDTLGLGPVGRDLLRMVARVATYAGDVDALDAAAVVGNVQLAYNDGVRYLDGGFQVLVEGLLWAARRAGVEVRRTAALAVQPSGDGGPFVVRTAEEDLTATTVVVAAGEPAAAGELLGRPATTAPGGPPITVACLELGLRRPPRHRVLFGVGEPLYLSAHCPPARLAPPGHAVVHVMRNHMEAEPLDARAQRAWCWEAARAAGVEAADVVEERFLARMVVTGAAPTAATGGLAGRTPVADATRPGILLAGDWVGPVGMLADAAVASGAAAGRLAAERSATMAVR